MSRWKCAAWGAIYCFCWHPKKKYDETTSLGTACSFLFLVTIWVLSECNFIFWDVFFVYAMGHDSFRSFRFLQAKAPIDLQLVQKGGLSSTLQAQHQELVALGRLQQGSSTWPIPGSDDLNKNVIDLNTFQTILMKNESYSNQQRATSMEARGMQRTAEKNAWSCKWIHRTWWNLTNWTWKIWPPHLQFPAAKSVSKQECLIISWTSPRNSPPSNHPCPWLPVCPRGCWTCSAWKVGPTNMGKKPDPKEGRTSNQSKGKLGSRYVYCMYIYIYKQIY